MSEDKNKAGSERKHKALMREIEETLGDLESIEQVIAAAKRRMIQRLKLLE